MGDAVIGFMMWGIDDDESCWLGGVLVGREHQNKGYERKAVQEAVAVLSTQTSATEFALSYQSSNIAAERLYTSMGFVKTGEMEDGEVVARLKLSDAPKLTPSKAV